MTKEQQEYNNLYIKANYGQEGLANFEAWWNSANDNQRNAYIGAIEREKNLGAQGGPELSIYNENIKADAYTASRKQWVEQGQKDQDARYAAAATSLDEKNNLYKANDYYKEYLKYKKESERLAEISPTDGATRWILGISKQQDAADKSMRENLELYQRSIDTANFKIDEKGVPQPITEEGQRRVATWDSMVEIENLSPQEKLGRALDYAKKGAEGALLDSLNALTKKENLALLGLVLTGWGIGHIAGYGYAADAVVAALGYILLGKQAIHVGRLLFDGVSLALSARSEQDFKNAGQKIAEGLAETLVAAGVAVGGFGIAKSASVVAGRIKNLRQVEKAPVANEQGTVSLPDGVCFTGDTLVLVPELSDQSELGEDTSGDDSNRIDWEIVIALLAVIWAGVEYRRIKRFRPKKEEDDEEENSLSDDPNNPLDMNFVETV
jgi:hypothetical protein